MEQTFQALGGILLKAIPTVILLLILHLYLKGMLFGPLRNILKKREELTEGARRTAAESLTLAESKAADFERKLQEARSDVYRQQEETRKRWLEDQATQLAEARARQDQAVKVAKDEIAAEAVAAKANLEQSSTLLANQIASSILARRAQ